MAIGRESTLHAKRRSPYTSAVDPETSVSMSRGPDSRGPKRLADSRGRRRLGWIATGLGGALMLWGVLHMTSHAVGGRVEDFAHRRTYNNTKIAVHEAFPGFLWRAALGLALVVAGARLRKVDAPA